jgi:PRTRC genetic system ThiF family protein
MERARRGIWFFLMVSRHLPWRERKCQGQHVLRFIIARTFQDRRDTQNRQGLAVPVIPESDEMMHRKPKRKEIRDNIADNFDLSHLNASPLKLTLPERHHQGDHGHTLKIYLVGCGGTGSWLAPHLVRLARFLRETRQMNVHLTFIDPDVVELKNVFRQNFGESEIGGKKAELLALRYAAVWGMAIEVHAARFDKAMTQLEYGDLGVIVGCVDNAAARRTIAETLDQETRLHSAEGLPRLWWLDCGNGAETGQVLFGAARTARQLQHAFPYWPDQGFCVNLPAPDLQHPDLLEAQTEQVPRQAKEPTVSCAEMLLMGDQSPSINGMVANVAATYLWRLFADPQGLTMFATYCNLNVLGTHSRFITPDAVAQAIGRKTTQVFKPRATTKRKEK